MELQKKQTRDMDPKMQKCLRKDLEKNKASVINNAKTELKTLWREPTGVTEAEEKLN